MNKSNPIDKFQEECGVFGIFSENEINISAISYVALSALQHRGQESCGICTYSENKINCYKGMGLVSDVFTREELHKLTGKSAIGHVRYSTFGESNLNNAQPILSGIANREIAIAHNGNITNAIPLKEELENKGVEFDTLVDSEIILKLIENKDIRHLEPAIVEAMKQLKGGYAVLLLTNEKLIGFRDPNGTRPLCIGKFKNSFILCSESCAIDAIGGKLIRDVYPGEIVTIDSKGLKSNYCLEKTSNIICAFEYIYFARADSVIDKLSVYKSRINVGKRLWEESPIDADIVIGVPQSGITAAVGFSIASGIPYDIGFVKNEYIGRTFIEPLQEKREANLEIKLSVIKSSVEGKRIVVIDDSIVRGTTSKKIVALLREAGAKEIHFRSASPIIKYPCFWGINTPNRSELLGSSNTVDEIKELIGADSLKYVSIDGLIKSFGSKITCLKCFLNQEEI